MGGGINVHKLRRAYEILRAPIPETSRRVLNVLASGKEMTVTEIGIDCQLPQSHASLALTKLHDTGYLHRRREGLFVHYRINEQMIQKVNRITGLFSTHPEKIMEE